jgi:hypothetical protein
MYGCHSYILCHTSIPGRKGELLCPSGDKANFDSSLHGFGEEMTNGKAFLGESMCYTLIHLLDGTCSYFMSFDFATMIAIFTACLIEKSDIWYQETRAILSSPIIMLAIFTAYLIEKSDIWYQETRAILSSPIIICRVLKSPVPIHNRFNCHFDNVYLPCPVPIFFQKSIW